MHFRESGKGIALTAQSIKNFNEETVFNIIGNTVTNHDNGYLFNYQPTFKPLDKLMDALEANRELYERLLASERENVDILQHKSKH